MAVFKPKRSGYGTNNRLENAVTRDTLPDTMRQHVERKPNSTAIFSLKDTFDEN